MQDIDLDDPDFWKKAVGLQEPPEQPESTAMIIGEKRQRKSTARFDPSIALIARKSQDGKWLCDHS